MDRRTQIWSSGGGVQSTAIAALICQGELRPDLAVIVDTERERQTTWDYLDQFVMPELKRCGVNLEIVKKSRYATVDLVSSKGDVLIPAFTTDGEGVGKLPTYCSNEWKSRVVHRWASEKGVKAADMWIGFTIDELKRLNQVTGKWQQRYPLIERRMTRGDCIAMVKRMGWPEPPRSSCYMCPNQSSAEWRWQIDNSPKDHDRAIEFDRKLREIDEDMWLIKDAVPLESADFSSQVDLFTGRCDSGMCFV